MKIEVAVLGSPLESLCGRKATVNEQNCSACWRAQQLCESRGGRPGLPIPNSPYGLCGRNARLEKVKCIKAQELCESRGGRPGPPAPNSAYGLRGRKATLKKFSSPEFRSCVKIVVAILGSPSLIVIMVSVDVKRHLKKTLIFFLKLLKSWSGGAYYVGHTQLSAAAFKVVRVSSENAGGGGGGSVVWWLRGRIVLILS